jgi:hypothetical protein
MISWGGMLWRTTDVSARRSSGARLYVGTTTENLGARSMAWHYTGNSPRAHRMWRWRYKIKYSRKKALIFISALPKYPE